MFGLSKILSVYFVAVPLALILGYSLSTPDQTTYVMVGVLVFALTLPIFIQWHHVLLICFWNSAFNFPFLPGQPHFWLLLALLSFFISWLNGLLAGTKFIRVPELNRPLIFLGIVVLMTGYLRGGIGIHALGNTSFGGRAYIYIFGGIVGYFALSAVRIPSAKAARWMSLFNLSGTTFILPNIAFLLGPAFYFVYYLLPGDFAAGQAEAEYSSQSILRIGGVSAACGALIFFFLVRWGLQGIFSYARPWRAVVFILTVFLSMMGGFRGSAILLGLLFTCQFVLEGLWRTRAMAFLLAGGLALGTILITRSDHLPLSIQRTICFLPIKVDPSVKADADGSLEWRLEMWRILVPQIPKYLLLGKGYAIDPTELYFAILDPGAEGTTAAPSLVAGDYHSGPLSTIIPLGLGGLAGFIWLLVAGVKVLYRNHRYGPPKTRRINTFLLAYFVSQVIFYFGVFGNFYSGLAAFTGLLGMSVSLNGGVRKPAQQALPTATQALIAPNALPAGA